MENRIADHKRGDTWNGISIIIEDSEIVSNVEVFTPKNLTGYSVRSRFKTSNTGNAKFEFSTDDNTITIPNPLTGEIIFMPRKMDVSANRYLFDIELTDPDGKVETVLDAIWNIVQDIT